MILMCFMKTLKIYFTIIQRYLIVKKEVYKIYKLIITNSICKYEEWNENSIENRQKGLSEIAKEVWKVFD